MELLVHIRAPRGLKLHDRESLLRLFVLTIVALQRVDRAYLTLARSTVRRTVGKIDEIGGQKSNTDSGVARGGWNVLNIVELLGT